MISKYFKSIYDDVELLREATVAKHTVVQTEGGREVNRQIKYYKLEGNDMKLQQLRDKLQVGEDSPLIGDFRCDAFIDRLHKKHLKIDITKDKIEKSV